VRGAGEGGSSRKTDLLPERRGCLSRKIPMTAARLLGIKRREAHGGTQREGKVIDQPKNLITFIGVERRIPDQEEGCTGKGTVPGRYASGKEAIDVATSKEKGKGRRVTVQDYRTVFCHYQRRATSSLLEQWRAWRGERIKEGVVGEGRKDRENQGV